MSSKLHFALLLLFGLSLAVVHVSSQSIGVELETDLYVAKQTPARKTLTTALKTKLAAPTKNADKRAQTIKKIFQDLSTDLVNPPGFAKANVLYATKVKTPLAHITGGHNGYEDRCFRFELDEDTTHQFDVEIVSAPFPFDDTGKQLLISELAHVESFAKELGRLSYDLAVKHRNDKHPIPTNVRQAAYCYSTQLPASGWDKTALADQTKFCPQNVAQHPADKMVFASPVDRDKKRYDSSYFVQGQPQVTVSLDVEELVDLFAHSDKLKPYGVPNFVAEYKAFEQLSEGKTPLGKQLKAQLDKAGDAWAGFLLILQKYYTIFHEMGGTPPYFKANIAMMFRTKMSTLFAASNPWRHTIPTTTKGNWFWKKVTAHADCTASAGHPLSDPDKATAKKAISDIVRAVADVMNSRTPHTETSLLRTSGDNENFDFWVYVDQIVEGTDIMDGANHAINGVTYKTHPMARLGLETMGDGGCAVIFELRKMAGGTQPATWHIPQLTHNLPVLFDWWRKANKVGVEKAVKDMPTLLDIRLADDPADPMKAP